MDALLQRNNSLFDHLINFAWLKRMLDKKERDCKTTLAPEGRRKR
jgi:hypothetical protein